MIKLLIAILILYGGVMILLCLLQRSFIYYPYKLDREFVFPSYAPGQEEIFITCTDGFTINGLFVPGKENTPAVLIFHGNGGNITHRDFLLREFSRLGTRPSSLTITGMEKARGGHLRKISTLLARPLSSG